MADFWDHSRAYSFFRPYVDLCTRGSFRRMEIVGAPPQTDAAVIIAPNHTNTLMDALVVLLSFPKGIVFGARADIFRKPRIAAIMHFLKIVPLARSNRDRPDEVARNPKTFVEIDHVLEHGMPFCIYSEGRHRPMHSLLPIRRGVATLAFRSAEQRPTVVVPVGLDYSDWFRYRGRMRMKYGEPIDVNALLPQVEGASVSARDSVLQDILRQKLSELIFYLPDDEHYEERLAEAMAARPVKHRFRRVLQAVLGFPLFLVSAVLALPMWALAEWICRFKIKDPAFQNTARFGVKLIGTPVFFILWGVALFLLLPWWAALIGLALFIPSYSIFYDWLNLVRPQGEPLW
ncbi:MAG: 1-acyl-sn-glycerol-3-phosphate acyltransferase [Bacteroidales bacterium]|nr:1-acyl-sn-glycerol-3-phosphate acyltransferase [Bacteroidales bacterium]